MTYVKEMWVLLHPEYYFHVKGTGYVPTEKATPEAIEAIKAVNEAIKREAELYKHGN